MVDLRSKRREGIRESLYSFERKEKDLTSGVHGIGTKLVLRQSYSQF